MSDPRWTDQARYLVARKICRYNPDKCQEIGSHRDQADDVLAALADAGLLATPGVGVEYAPGIRKGRGHWERIGNVPCASRIEADLLVSTYNKRHYETVHGQRVILLARPLGPWQPAPTQEQP